MTSMEMVDGRRVALEFFKDWSNYLLVATVAAIGWLGSDNVAFPSDAWRAVSLGALVVSLVFGVLTLALVPLVAEQIGPEHESIYAVRVEFLLFRRTCHAYLTQACRPQHIFFMVGLAVFAAGAVGTRTEGTVGAALAVVAAGLFLGWQSRPSRVRSARLGGQTDPERRRPHGRSSTR